MAEYEPPEVATTDEKWMRLQVRCTHGINRRNIRDLDQGPEYDELVILHDVDLALLLLYPADQLRNTVCDKG